LRHAAARPFRGTPTGASERDGQVPEATAELGVDEVLCFLGDLIILFDRGGDVGLFAGVGDDVQPCELAATDRFDAPGFLHGATLKEVGDVAPCYVSRASVSILR